MKIYLLKTLSFILVILWSFNIYSQGNKKTAQGKSLQKITLLRGPYLQVPTTGSMIIRWRTDKAIKGKIKYGTILSALNKEIVEETPTTDHVMKIDGLAPHTKYYYAVIAGSTLLQGNAENTFTTLPVAGKEGIYRIGIFGDPGSPTTMQPKVRDQFLKYLGTKEMNAWVALGDIAYNQGLDAEYQSEFFNIYKDKLLKKYPLFTLPGNHDYRDSDAITYYPHKAINYYSTFSMPVDGESGGIASHNQAYYSFDIGNIHILNLDSFGAEDSTLLSDTSGPQVQWVKKDLEANKNRDWVIAMWHHPPYSMGSHNSDEQSDMYKIRENFLPLLERYGVDLVICGHSHLYERSKLMQGHFGKEATFDPGKHALSISSGLYNGTVNSCAYIKDETNTGTVYVVNGGSSEVGGLQEKYPHNAMYYSNNVYGGANMIEVYGNRLDMKWICEDGVIRDKFTMMKNVNRSASIHIKKGESALLTASFVGDYIWSNNLKTKSIRVAPPVTTIFTVHDKYHCLRDTFEVVVSE